MSHNHKLNSYKQIQIIIIYHFFNFAEFGYYLPKAFYTIDANGEQSPLSLISPHSVSKISYNLFSTSFLIFLIAAAKDSPSFETTNIFIIVK